MTKQYVMTFSREEIGALHRQLTEAATYLEKQQEHHMHMILDEDGEVDELYATMYAPLMDMNNQLIKENIQLRKAVEHAGR